MNPATNDPRDGQPWPAGTRRTATTPGRLPASRALRPHQERHEHRQAEDGERQQRVRVHGKSIPLRQSHDDHPVGGAMLKKCRQAIDEAAVLAGRPSRPKRRRGTSRTASRTRCQRLAREDNARWRTLTRDQQMTEAPRPLSKTSRPQALRKLDNAERQVVKVAETENRITGLQESFAGTKGHDGTRAESFKQDMNISHAMATAEKKMRSAGSLTSSERLATRRAQGSGASSS
jgi:hypothetical protein